jgi:hypothetical protein
MANTEMLVARRNPEDQQSTTDLYWTEGISLIIPPVVEKNARVEDLKNRLNQIANLPGLDVATGQDIGYAGPASFRDMAAFNFQPQHIVANPYTFFFKAETTEHREKLRNIFPLALGAVDSTTLAKQRELKDLAREHDRLRRELDARLGAARAWEAEVETYYLQARGLGLLPNSGSPDPTWRLEKYLLELQNVPEAVRTMDLPDIAEGTNEAAAKELTKIIDEEDRLGSQIGSVRRRLAKLDQLSSSVGDYRNLLSGQEDRLQGVGWLEERVKDSHKCPVCEAVHPEGNTHLDELRTLASELKSLSASVYQAPAKLDVELAEIRQELRELEVALSKARHKRKQLESQSAEQAGQRQRVRQIYLFVGRVEQALENVSRSQNVDELREQVKALEDRITVLRRDLDPRAQKERVNAAIDFVSARMADYGRQLQLEHISENVRLNLRELTLQFSPLSGRTDFLWEVGSGQNWVGYHIAGLLGLHEHFVGLRENHVPRFLLIDQPSQVYFPEAWPSIEQVPDTHTKVATSADIEGVRRIFRALSSFLEAVNSEFQIIVTEHAGAITWESVPHVHVVGNWRRGHDDFLIPDAWFKTA